LRHIQENFAEETKFLYVKIRRISIFEFVVNMALFACLYVCGPFMNIGQGNKEGFFIISAQYFDT